MKKLPSKFSPSISLIFFKHQSSKCLDIFTPNGFESDTLTPFCLLNTFVDRLVVEPLEVNVGSPFDISGLLRVFEFWFALVEMGFSEVVITELLVEADFDVWFGKDGSSSMLPFVEEAFH